MVSGDLVSLAFGMLPVGALLLTGAWMFREQWRRETESAADAAERFNGEEGIGDG